MVDRDGVVIRGQAPPDVVCCDAGEEAWCDEALWWVNEIRHAHEAFGDDHVVGCRFEDLAACPCDRAVRERR